MKKIYYIILTLLISIQLSFGSAVAIVGEEIISTYDLKKRVDLVINSQLKPVSSSELPTIILKSLRALTDEYTQKAEAKKQQIIVSNNELEENLQIIAKNNNMSKEKFLRTLENRKIDIESLKNQVESQIISSKLVQNNILPKINVTDREINEAIETNSEIDVELNLKKISINFIDIKDSIKKKHLIETLKSKIKNCQNLEFLINRKFPEFRIKYVKTSAKKLPNMIKNEILYTDLDKSTKIMRSKNTFEFYVICDKKYLNFSNQERQIILETLTNNKIILQTNLYLSQLRKKTHIEIKEEALQKFLHSFKSQNVLQEE